MTQEILRTTLRAGGAPAADRRLRVLMVHWDGGGNIAPQRALARELRRRGHGVHVLTHDGLAETVAADGGTFHALPTTPQFPAALPHTTEWEYAFIARHICGSPEFAADFLAAHAALRPDLCVIDAMLLTTLNAAIEHALPFVAFNHIAWTLEGGCTAFLSSIAADLPGRAAGSTFFGLLERAPMVLAASYPEFGTSTQVAPHIHFVGPIREPAAHAPWPRRFPDRPFVLVSLSTIFQGQETTLRSVCDGLASLPLEVLVTTGRGIAPEALTVSGGVEARSFVPHDAVLPFADLVVTHAGLGTSMFCAGAGVPMLCLPNGRDQNDNAARVVGLGLGGAIPPDAAPAEIGDAVMEMLRDNALRAACRSFAARVSRFGDLTRAADLVVECVRSAV